MSMPRISVCLPNLNTRPFLEERVATIFAQTFTDWELIVSDSYSKDGSWEFFQELAARDPRVLISQEPPGLYENWNHCIRHARGEYIYFATSDDTMAPNCLERLMRALDEHPDCDLAHCPLRIVGENGQPLPDVQEWWSHRSLFARSSGSLRERSHIRRAPFDGLLLLGGETVYNSITELMIRRSLFDRIGFFEPRWGSIGDFNWAMRASLVANTVHVPDTWGGWRMHSNQATAGLRLLSPEHASKIDEMIDHAIERSQPFLAAKVGLALTTRWRDDARDIREFLRERRKRTTWLSRQRFLFERLLTGSRAARQFLKDRFTGRNRDPFFATAAMTRWFQSVGFEHVSEIS